MFCGSHFLEEGRGCTCTFCFACFGSDYDKCWEISAGAGETVAARALPGFSLHGGNAACDDVGDVLTIYCENGKYGHLFG